MNPIPGPIILLALPLIAAAVAYLLRRLTLLAALISTLTTGLLAALCWRLPLDRSSFVLGQEVGFGRPIVVLGQTLMLDPAGQMWLVFVFGLVAFFYLFAWRMSQGRSFFSFSLVVVALYVLVVLLQSFALATLILAISATLLVFVLQAGQPSLIRGAQRYLVITLLAVPLLLLASWFVDQSAVYFQDIEGLAGGSSAMAEVLSQAMARRALLPAALGFGLLLAAFPFGTWMPAVAAEAPPMVSAFVFTVGQSMALYLAMSFLGRVPSLLQDSTTLIVIQLAGLVMAAAGGVMAAVQRDFGRLFGYAALSDLGILLLALGSGGSQGLRLALLHGINRSVSITLVAAALAVLRHRATTDRFEALRGMGRHLPVATAGLVLGGLALAGFPFTAGFGTHWAVRLATWNWVQPFSPQAEGSVPPAMGIVPLQEWLWVLTLVALIASSLGIVVGLLRGLGAMQGDGARPDVARQPIIASLLVLGLAAFSLVLGLYPQLFLEPVSEAVRMFSLF
ncbi:MAG: proton-conducting transporter membrane subunit [Anaerolineae bacterium]|jgi:formate hydrogenlyase subunit 3/multisubunit Na+/H+ antiporter MnhD subunit